MGCSRIFALLLVFASYLAAGAEGGPGSEMISDGVTITPGKPVKGTDYLFIAGVKQLPTNAHVCGGFFLNNNTALTTATCALRAAGQNRPIHIAPEPMRMDNPEKYIKVTVGYIHPKYMKSPEDNDLAVLKFKANKTAMSDVKFVKLDPNINYGNDEDVVVFGRGIPENHTHLGIQLLYQVGAVIPDSICNAITGDNIRRSMICIGTRALEQIAMDFGTPAVVERVNWGKKEYYAIGILTDNNEDLVKVAPYLLLAPHISWIKEKMENPVAEKATTEDKASRSLNEESNAEGDSAYEAELGSRSEFADSKGEKRSDKMERFFKRRDVAGGDRFHNRRAEWKPLRLRYE